MEYLTLIINLLASYGAAYVISKGEIFAPVRLFLAKKSRFAGNLLYCPICVSFWTALAITCDAKFAFATVCIVYLVETYLESKYVR
jgi:hypothetical protein